MKVFPHTTKFGYHTLSPMQTYRYRNKIPGALWSNVNNTVLQAISYRKPLNKGNGRDPTDYCRAIVRLNSLAAPKFEVGSGFSALEFESQSSIHVWCPLLSAPWGNNAIASGSITIDGDLRERAILGAKAKLNKIEANLLEDFGQALSMAREVGTLFNSIATATQAFIAVASQTPALMPKGVEVDRTLAAAWLTWYYGIKPLISTIQAIGKGANPRYGMYNATATRSRQLDPLGAVSGAMLYGHVASGSFTQSARCTLKARIKMSDTIATLANLGIGTSLETARKYGKSVKQISNGSAIDVVTTAWALLPYSFVFDWLVPVENVLRGMYWSPSIEYLSGQVTKHISGSATITVTKPRGFQLARGRQPKLQLEALLFQRESFPFVPPSSNLYVNRSISPSNLMSAIALVIAR